MAKPPCGRLWSHRPGEERLIDFLAQMPTGTMILLTMAVSAIFWTTVNAFDTPSDERVLQAPN